MSVKHSKLTRHSVDDVMMTSQHNDATGALASDETVDAKSTLDVSNPAQRLNPAKSLSQLPRDFPSKGFVKPVSGQSLTSRPDLEKSRDVRSSSPTQSRRFTTLANSRFVH